MTSNTLWFWIVLLAVCGWSGWGCHTPQGPGSGSLASVEIKGQTLIEVAQATSEVFRAAGYTTIPSSSKYETKLLFEKAGTKADALLYSGWSGGEVWYRTKITFVSLTPETQLIKCDAYRVLDRNDPHFEEEKKLSWSKKGVFQDLLNQVKARLNPQAK